MNSLFDHPRASKVLQIVAILATVAGIVVNYLAKKGATTNPTASAVSTWTQSDTFWIIVVGLLIVALILTIASFRRSRTQLDAGDPIYTLSALQGSYILKPRYITAKEHSEVSKESKLGQGATADILTNSLKYDIFYASEIAANIIRGATYIYILPNTSGVITDLRNYITKICDELQKGLLAQQVQGPAARFEELRANNLSFFFFNGEKPCLYNFAIFRQPAEGGLEPFQQYWWYINPSSTAQGDHMLTHEIASSLDQANLDRVFASLKSDAIKRSGREISDQRDNLSICINA